MRLRQRERKRSADLGADLLQTAIFRSNLTTSLVPYVGAGGPTWSRATKAWGFNELGYLEELASGCAFFGGARLVRNLAPKSEVINAGWTISGGTASDANTLLESAGGTVHQCATSIITLGTYLLEAWLKRGTGSTRHVRLEVSSSDTARVNFNLDTGEVASIAQSGSLSLVSYGADADVDAGGYRRFYIRVNASASASNTFYPARLTESLNGPISYSGDGTSSILISKVKISDVTNYDVSYIPEYVSVGVASSPFFGAGIDGAKYFSTDYTGGRALTNLIGFRREAAATNNLLQCRNLTQNAWGAPANGGIGSEILTNGAFAAATDWTRTGAAYWSVSGGVLNLNAADASASYYDNSQTYALLVTGKQYLVEFDYVHTSGAAPIISLRGGDAKVLGNVTGRKTVTVTCGASVAGYGIRIGTFAAAVATIDNITIKEAPVQCSQTATGLDGIANTATTLTATAADAIILQPISLASAARCASAYVKRRTGTGTISFTQDGGSTWTDITSQINDSTWSRVQITSTLANPSVGFKISTIGDEIDVDCVQNEAGSVATSPIITTSAAVTRNAEILTYQVSGNIDFTVGTAIGSVQSSGSSALRYLINVGTSYSYISSAQANTEWRVTDGTNTTSISGLQDLTAGRVKRAISWSGGSINITGDGVTPVSGTFDGTFGDGSTISIGLSLNGTVRDVAIWPVALTNAQLQALTA